MSKINKVAMTMKLKNPLHSSIWSNTKGVMYVTKKQHYFLSHQHQLQSFFFPLENRNADSFEKRYVPRPNTNITAQKHIKIVTKISGCFNAILMIFIFPWSSSNMKSKTILTPHFAWTSYNHKKKERQKRLHN